MGVNCYSLGYSVILCRRGGGSSQQAHVHITTYNSLIKTAFKVIIVSKNLIHKTCRVVWNYSNHPLKMLSYSVRVIFLILLGNKIASIKNCFKWNLKMNSKLPLSFVQPFSEPVRSIIQTILIAHPTCQRYKIHSH